MGSNQFVEFWDAFDGWIAVLADVGKPSDPCCYMGDLIGVDDFQDVNGFLVLLTIKPLLGLGVHIQPSENGKEWRAMRDLIIKIALSYWIVEKS